MRREDRKIHSNAEIIDILNENQVCRLGMCDGAVPYVVPLNFGYEYLESGEFIFYFHTAIEGRKLTVLQENPNVCIEIDCNHAVITGEAACQHSFAYRSIIATGTAHFLENHEDKVHAFNQIMFSVTQKSDWNYDKKVLERVGVFKVVVTDLTGKQRLAKA